MSVERAPPQLPQRNDRSTSEWLSVLFLAACPYGTQDVDLQHTIQLLQSDVDRMMASQLDVIRFASYPAVRVDDIMTLLNDDFLILHIYSHVSGSKAIMFQVAQPKAEADAEEGYGTAHPSRLRQGISDVERDKEMKAFRGASKLTSQQLLDRISAHQNDPQYKRKLRLIILTGCNSDVIAQNVVNSSLVMFAIGTTTDISSDEAQYYSKKLYHFLLWQRCDVYSAHMKARLDFQSHFKLGDPEQVPFVLFHHPRDSPAPIIRFIPLLSSSQATESSESNSPTFGIPLQGFYVHREKPWKQLTAALGMLVSNIQTETVLPSSLHISSHTLPMEFGETSRFTSPPAIAAPPAVVPGIATHAPSTTESNSETLCIGTSVNSTDGCDAIETVSSTSMHVSSSARQRDSSRVKRERDIASPLLTSRSFGNDEKTDGDSISLDHRSLKRVAIQQHTSNVFLPYSDAVSVPVHDSVSMLVVQPPRTDAARVTVVLRGLGGIGKSQLALAFCNGTTAQYSKTAWLKASNTTLETYYRLFAVDIKVCEAGSQLSLTEVVLLVNKWLLARSNWLLIFDNADSYNQISSYLPVGSESSAHRNQHIIITSRHQDWPDAFASIDVDEAMTETESMDLISFLMHRSKRRQPPVSTEPDHHIYVEQLKCLVATLYQYPLALSQSGAYLDRRPFVHLKEYITQVDLHLLSHSAKLPVADIQEMVVSKVFNSTLKALTEECMAANIPSLASLLLTVCAYLHADTIPVPLLQSWLQKKFPAEVQQENDLLMTLLSILCDYSLLHNEETVGIGTVRIHRILQKVLKQQHQHSRRGDVQQDSVYFPIFSTACFTDLVLILNDEFRNPKQFRTIERTLVQHMNHLSTLYDEIPELTREKISIAYSSLFINMGGVLWQQVGDYKQAQSVLEKARQIYHRMQKSQHFNMAVILLSLGQVHGLLGDFQQRKEMLESALTILESQPDDEGSIKEPRLYKATVLSNLCEALRMVGDYQRAWTTAELANDLNKQFYPDTLWRQAWTTNVMGAIARELGDYQKSQQLLEQSFKMNQDHLGKDHYETACESIHLAITYRYLEMYDKSLQLLEHAVAIAEKNYGLEHTKLALASWALGDTCRTLKQYDRALALLNRAYEIYSAQWGLTHEYTARVLASIGRVRHCQGDHNTAKRAMEHATSTLQLRCGNSDVGLAELHHDLGTLYLQMGQYLKAADVSKAAAQIRSVVYGQGHSATLASTTQRETALGLAVVIL